MYPSRRGPPLSEPNWRRSRVRARAREEPASAAPVSGSASPERASGRRRRRRARWRRIDKARSHPVLANESRRIRDRGRRIVQPLAGIDLGRGSKARLLRALADRPEDDPPADLDRAVKEHEEWDGGEESRDDALLQDERQERRRVLGVP